MKRSAAVMCLALVAALVHPVLSNAYELRASASGAIVRPDDQGYTSFWDWGPGAGLGIELIPDRSDFGAALWLDFAQLPGRDRVAVGDTIEAESWNMTRVFAGVRGRLHPFPESRWFALTGDLAAGGAFHRFGDVHRRGVTVPNFLPGGRESGFVVTFGAGIEFIGETWGGFVDIRSEMYSEDVSYTWNTKRVGVIRRFGGRPEL